MTHLVRHLRAARLAFAAMLVSGTLVAGGARAAEREATICADPWTELGFAPAFAPDDAYVFDDVTRAARLDADAVAVAIRRDLDRLDDRAGAAESDGRVSDAFGRFIAFGPNAYASLDSASDAAATAVAQVPDLEPSRLALAIRDGLR